MVSAAQLGWGSGWPNCPTSYIVTAVVGDNGIRLPVRREIVTLVAGLVHELEVARQRDWVQYGCWGFACRAISGTSIPSNHSQGCAIDLDAPSNPHASAATHAAPHWLRKWYPEAGKYLCSTMPLDAAAIARRWGFYWGGLYPKPDPMHFECNLPPAQVARLIADLRELDGRPVTPPPAPPEEDDMTPAQDAILNAIAAEVRNIRKTGIFTEDRITSIAAEVSLIRQAGINTENRVVALAAQVAELAKRVP